MMSLTATLALLALLATSAQAQEMRCDASVLAEVCESVLPVESESNSDDRCWCDGPCTFFEDCCEDYTENCRYAWKSVRK